MKIGEAAARSGVSARMIRHYEGIGLIPTPLRRDSGYRDYDLAEVRRLMFIANARDLGFAIDEIRALLDLWDNDHRASADVKALALAHAGELGRKVAQLQQMQRELLTLAERCHGDDRPECPIMERIAGSA